jgi:hypothetical protein
MYYKIKEETKYKKNSVEKKNECFWKLKQKKLKNRNENKWKTSGNERKNLWIK